MYTSILLSSLLRLARFLHFLPIILSNVKQARLNGSLFSRINDLTKSNQMDEGNICQSMKSKALVHYSNKVFKKGQEAKYIFGVQHFAGTVAYSSQGFREKNSAQRALDLDQILFSKLIA